jgi:hypothetical protein
VHTIENAFLRAELGDRGELRSLLNKATGTTVVDGGGEHAWRLTLGGSGVSPAVVGSGGRVCAVERERDGLAFAFSSISLEGSALPIRVVAHVKADGASLVWRARIANGSDRVVESFEYPVLSGTLFRDAEGALYRPRGAGERIERPEKLDTIDDLQYPPASMQWLEYATPSEGLYFSPHDSSFESTGMLAKPSQGKLSLSFVKHPFLKQGETWTSSTYVSALHAGGWHEGAKLYRAWADTWFRREPPPAWVQDLQGWFLVILKQQNDTVMWKYSDLPELLDFAERSGIDMISPFGWAIGGHDHLYPDYSVAPELGTRKKLESSIRKVKARGGRVILYTNGQLIDTTGDFYRTVGKRISAKQRDGTEHSEFWHKFADHSGYKHVIACQSTKEWGDKLLELAEYVADIGADGLIYDQIGGGSHGRFCFDASHGHRTPAEAMGPGIVRNLARVRREIKARYPDFCLVTEHVGDAVCQSIDWIHGSGFAVHEQPNAFPSLFRYTFPEYRFSNRQGSGAAPYMSYAGTNFAVVHGMQIDIESRYPADVALIRSGKRPKKEDYANVLTPPEIDIVASGPIEDYRKYLARVLKIRAKHPVLMRGTFRDDDGVAVLKGEVTVRRYDLGDETAVIVWNHADFAQKVSLTVRGRVLERIVHPDAKRSGSTVPAERLAFFFFGRAP